MTEDPHILLIEQSFIPFPFRSFLEHWIFKTQEYEKLKFSSSLNHMELETMEKYRNICWGDAKEKHRNHM